MMDITDNILHNRKRPNTAPPKEVPEDTVAGCYPVTYEFTTHHAGLPHQLVRFPDGETWLCWRHPDGQLVTEQRIDYSPFVSVLAADTEGPDPFPDATALVAAMDEPAPTEPLRCAECEGDLAGITPTAFCDACAPVPLATHTEEKE